jgi:hypothetical protein
MQCSSKTTVRDVPRDVHWYLTLLTPFRFHEYHVMVQVTLLGVPRGCNFQGL